eukprot:EG_transcript_12422
MLRPTAMRLFPARARWLLIRPAVHCQDFIAMKYENDILGTPDMGLAQLAEAKACIGKGKLERAIAPLNEAVDIFAGAGDAAWEWKWKADLLLGHCLYRLGQPPAAAAALEASFARLAELPAPELLDSRLRLAYLVWYGCCVLQEPAGSAARQRCGGLLRRLAEGAGEAAVAGPLGLLAALLSAQPEEATAANPSVQSQLSPEDHAYHTALALLVQAHLRYGALPAKERPALVELTQLLAEAMHVLSTAFGEMTFSGQEVQPEQRPAVDLFSSVLHTAATVHMDLMRLPAPPPSDDAERPPDSQATAAAMLSRALTLNRVVCPEQRNNPKAAALLEQLYGLYVEIGLYVQVSGIFNTLLRCLEQLHGPKSAPVARLMRQQLQFLRQVNAMMEAKVLEEQLRAVAWEGAAA